MDERLDPWIEGYLEYIRDVGRKAPRTIIDIRCTLRHAVRCMAHIRPDVSLWKLTLADYLRWIEQEREQGRSTGCLEKYISHIRGLLDYAWRSGRSDRNVLDGFNLQDSKQRAAPRVLSIEEASRLVESCPCNTFAQRRRRMVVLLLYGCGLRTVELCDLNLTDVNRERGELLIRKGKGDVQRVIPIPQGIQVELWAYLLDREGKRGAMFQTEQKKKRISAHEVCRIVKQAAEQAKITWKVTPRTLRHTYATHLMDRGVDLAVISSLMGHRSPTETGVYLHVLDGRSEQAVDKLVRRPAKEDES